MLLMFFSCSSDLSALKDIKVAVAWVNKKSTRNQESDFECKDIGGVGGV